jgi:hypothetical protein
MLFIKQKYRNFNGLSCYRPGRPKHRTDTGAAPKMGCFFDVEKK